jgi:hypothetical protein
VPHHVDNLSKKQTALDPCLLVKRDENSALQGLVGIQVDDSLFLGDARFVEDEKREVQRFKCKDASVLGAKFLEFNGAEIHRLADNKLVIKQPNHIMRMAAATNLTEFVSQRALGAYIASLSRPDLLGEFQLLASAAREPMEANIKKLNKILYKARGTASLGLSFCCLDPDGDLRIVAFSDAGFASHEDKSSQLGYVILLVVRTPFLVGKMKRHKLASLLPTWRRGLDRLYSKSLSTGSLQGLQRLHLHGVPHGTPSAGRPCWHGRYGLFSAKASR